MRRSTIIFLSLIIWAIHDTKAQDYIFVEDSLAIVHSANQNSIYYSMDSTSGFEKYNLLLQNFFNSNFDTVYYKFSELDNSYFHSFEFTGGKLNYYDSSRIDLYLIDSSHYSLRISDSCIVSIGMHCSQLETCFSNSYMHSVSNNWNNLSLPFTIYRNEEHEQIDRYLMFKWDSNTNIINYIRTTDQE